MVFGDVLFTAPLAHVCSINRCGSRRSGGDVQYLVPARFCTLHHVHVTLSFDVTRDTQEIKHGLTHAYQDRRNIIWK